MSPVFAPVLKLCRWRFAIQPDFISFIFLLPLHNLIVNKYDEIESQEGWQQKEGLFDAVFEVVVVSVLLS